VLDWFKVEQWSRDGNAVERLLWAGNRIEVARETFDAVLKHRPRGRYTIRQGSSVLAKWPDE
jgi:glycogen debranching enzyme